VAAATGDFSAAIEAYEAASAIVPDPVTLAALGDLYALTGDAAAAEDRYATVGAIATLAGANRQAYNRAYAQFLADHDRDVALALSLAEQELEVRKDPVGYDAYAWALYRNGRFPEARAASETALAAGGRRAVMLYHAGMISAALGDADRALAELQEAMALNAGFDPLQARTAAEAIEALT
jgi:tetratricopeptide (TPR) repeat protein